MRKLLFVSAAAFLALASYSCGNKSGGALGTAQEDSVAIVEEVNDTTISDEAPCDTVVADSVQADSLVAE